MTLDLTANLGVQSYCFRHFKDNAQIAHFVHDLGLRSIELCGVHVDLKAPDTWPGVIAAYTEQGVNIVSLGVQGLGGNEAAERPYFEFIKLAGIKHMSASFHIGAIPDAFRLAEKLAEEYDIQIGIHNHGGKHWLGNAETLAWVFGQTSERIGLCLDTAWALDAGENPIKLVERFADRFYGSHIKDFVFDEKRKPEDVIVGTGGLDLKALVSHISQNSNVVMSVLEYEGDAENPVPTLAECVAAVRSAV